MPKQVKTTEQLELPEARDVESVKTERPDAVDVNEPIIKQPEIDSFSIMNVQGEQYIIGLGLDDSRIYNWDVHTAAWRLFAVAPEVNQLGAEAPAAEPPNELDNAL